LYFVTLTRINSVVSIFKTLNFFYALWENLISKTLWITPYYSRSENIWNDGFLFDFLQKKSADAWVRRFVIYTGFLFSERVVFEFVVRIYLDNMIWLMHTKSIFEASNTSEMLTTTLFLVLSLFLIIFLISIYTLV